MGSDVIECLGKVMCPRNNTVLTDHNGTNGNFALFEGLLCLSQRLAHVNFVFIFLLHVCKGTK